MNREKLIEEMVEMMECFTEVLGSHIEAIDLVNKQTLGQLREVVVETKATDEEEMAMFLKTTNLLTDATEIFCDKNSYNIEEVLEAMLEMTLSEQSKKNSIESLIEELAEKIERLEAIEEEAKVEEEITATEENILRRKMISDLMSGKDVRDVAIECLVETGLIDISPMI